MTLEERQIAALERIAAALNEKPGDAPREGESYWLDGRHYYYEDGMLKESEYDFNIGGNNEQTKS